MRGKFGWDLPPGVSHHMIEEQAGAFEEEEAMDRLVEDIPEELIEKFVEIGYEPRRKYRTVLDARRRAPAQIRFILSAVHDGRLEKQLGVLGRGEAKVGEDFQWPDTRKGWNYPEFRWGWGRKLERAWICTEAAEPTDLDDLEGQLISLIALRKEEE